MTRFLCPFFQCKPTHLLTSSFSIEDFQMLEENSFLHPKFVGDNLSNFACAFIGMGLTAERKHDAGREIWQNLFQKSKAKLNGAFNEKQTKFSQFISRWFQWNEYSWLIDYHNKNLVDKITSRSGDQFAAICEQRLKLMLELNPKSPDYLHYQAILQFHRGNTRDALNTIGEIEKLIPQGMSPMFSRAFLTLWQRKYKPAMRCFKKLGKLNSLPPPFVMSVIAFYESLIVQYPDRHELKFGSAFVNDFFVIKRLRKRTTKVSLKLSKMVDGLHLMPTL